MGAQKAVNHEVCVSVGSRDRSRRVDAGGVGDWGTRDIERGEGAVGASQVTVTGGGFTVESRDHPSRVDGVGEAASKARRVDRGDGAVSGPQEAMRRAACVSVQTDDRFRVVDGDGPGAKGKGGEACGA